MTTQAAADIELPGTAVDSAIWSGESESPAAAKGIVLIVVGAYLSISFFVYIGFLFWAWEGAGRAVTANGPVPVMIFAWRVHPTPDVALLCVVLASSMLGSAVHALMSFCTYVGNGRFRVSWVAWYILRAQVGGALALVLYFVTRSGFLAANSGSGSSSIDGAAAVGGMAGLFAKQAADKLEEIFDTVFRTGPGYGDSTRRDGSGK